MAGKGGKAKNILIKLVSTASTGFFYTTTKNPRNVTRKLSLKKVECLTFPSCSLTHSNLIHFFNYQKP